MTAAIKPCPFCGSRCEVCGDDEGQFAYVGCVDIRVCGYDSGGKDTGAEAIAAHNRIALAVELHGELVDLLTRARPRLRDAGFLWVDIDAALARARGDQQPEEK